MKSSFTKDSFFGGCGIAMLLVAAVYLVWTTVVGLVVSYTPFPMGDSWGMVMFMDKFAHQMNLFEYLWQEHNEHRILFTKSLLLFDYYLLGGQKLYLIGILHLLNAGIFLLVYRFFRRNVWDKILLLTLIAVFFSLAQFENFDSAFQLQFFFVNLFAVLSFISFERWISFEKPVDLVWTIVWAALAAVNMSNGLFVIFSLVCVGFLIPRKLHVVVLPVSCVAIWCLYFFHYESLPESGNFRFTFGFLTRLIEYVFMFVGNPFQLGTGSNVGVYVFGGIGFFLGLWILGTFLFDRKAGRKGSVFSTTAILFVFISIVAVAYGRLKVGGPEQALTGRYSSTALLYWAVITGFYWRSFPLEKKFGKYCFLIAVILGVGSIAYRQSLLFQQMHHMAQQRELIQASVLSNVKDMKLIRQAFAHYRWITFERMKDQNMLPFRGGKYPNTGIGHKVSTDRCEREKCLSILSIEERRIADSDEIGYMLIGESSVPLESRQLAIINAENEIVGYAAKLRYQGAILPGYEWEGGNDYWVGFVGASSQSIQLLSLVDADRKFTRSKVVYEQNSSVLGLSLYSSVKIGENLDRSRLEVAVEKTDSFHANGYYAGIREDKPFDVFGTWSQFGEMKYTGAISFDVGINDSYSRPSVLLPFVLGPNRKGVEILVHSYDRNQTYNLPLDNLITHHWYFLDVTNALSGKGLRVEILDNSGEWGEWLAVGTPFVLSNPRGDSIPVVIKKKEK